MAERVFAQMFDQMRIDARLAATDGASRPAGDRRGRQYARSSANSRCRASRRGCRWCATGSPAGASCAASPPIDDANRLRNMLKDSSVEGWSWVALMGGVGAIDAKLYVPRVGWTTNLQTATRSRRTTMRSRCRKSATRPCARGDGAAGQHRRDVAARAGHAHLPRRGMTMRARPLRSLLVARAAGRARARARAARRSSPRCWSSRCRRSSSPGMLWRQQVQIRRIENQRVIAQAQWVARGARLDPDDPAFRRRYGARHHVSRRHLGRADREDEAVGLPRPDRCAQRRRRRRHLSPARSRTRRRSSTCATSWRRRRPACCS